MVGAARRWSETAARSDRRKRPTATAKARSSALPVSAVEMRHEGRALADEEGAEAFRAAEWVGARSDGKSGRTQSR